MEKTESPGGKAAYLINTPDDLEKCLLILRGALSSWAQWDSEVGLAYNGINTLIDRWSAKLIKSPKATWPVRGWPRWQCPDCGSINWYGDTFFEICGQCQADYTNDWHAFVLSDGPGPLE